MDEQKRLLLALALIALVVVGMTFLWPTPDAPPRPPAGRDGGTKVSQSEPRAQEPAKTPDAGPSVEEEGPDQEPAPPPEPEPVREMFDQKRLTLRTSKLIVEVHTWGGGLVKAELQEKQFREGRGEKAHQIDLVSAPVIERPELTPLMFQLISKSYPAPRATESAEGKGVLKMLSYGVTSTKRLAAMAELDEATAAALVGKRPYSTLEQVRRAVGGDEARQQRVLEKLVAAAWLSGYVRLDFEVVSHDESERIVLRGLTSGRIAVRRTITLVDEYQLQIRDVLVNQGSKLRYVRERLRATGLEKQVGGGGCYGRPVGQLAGLCLHGEDMIRRNRDRLAGESGGCMGGCDIAGCSGGPPGKVTQSGDIRFVAIDRHYFMAALSPSEAWGRTTCYLDAQTTGELEVAIEPVVPVELRPEEHTTYVSTLYLGPKKVSLLKTVAPGRQLWEAVDYGWFAVLSRLLLQALRLFHGWLGNWGLAIILLTFLIKLILLPVSHKTFKNMREMQRDMSKLKPQLDEINEQYKDKPEVKQQKTMELYQKNGINPLKQITGCLPMFLQMPIWIALYRMISESVELYRAPFVLWLDDLSAQDPYYILPALLGASMFVQQLITPAPGVDNQQQKMMRWMMPGMFLIIMINMPSGLVLYIFVNTLLTIVQQQLINRTVPTEPVPEAKSGGDAKPKESTSDTGTSGNGAKRSRSKAKAKRRKRK